MNGKRGPAAATISCVVPAYNEAATLPRLLTVLTAQLKALVPRWEVIVIDDGSRDDTAAVMVPWLLTPGVRYLQLSRNFGKEAALSAELDHARGEVVVLLDADLQHPPAMIAPMLQAWAAGADADAGSHLRITPDVGDFRLMDRRVVDAFVALPERNRFLKGLYAWVGFRTELLPYQPAPRTVGRSSFSLVRLAKLAVTGVTSFSNLPLRPWSGLGTVIPLAAFGYGVWVVIEHFVEGHPVPGYAMLVAALMFFSGVQLLSIGVLGEYIGRIFDEVKNRPLYLVGRDLGRIGLEP